MGYKGYMGKLLRINLSTGSAVEEEISPDVMKNYMGGAGFGIKYLFDEVPATTDALSEENKLIFSLGPLGGTNAPCASRMSVTAKSPLTNCVGMCMTGGYFPVEMKFAGYDMLIIEGKAKEPSYIYVNEGKVSIRSAKKIWGMKTFDSQQIIKDELNDQNIRIACIGPAGENLSKLACIINERRAAGRKGLGAVMGSKNLKAIAIRGKKSVPIANEAENKAAISRMLKAMKESPVLYSAFSKLGTSMVVHQTSELGIFPTKNFAATGSWNVSEHFGEDNVNRKLGNEHCYRCPVGCSQIRMPKNSFKGMMSAPEFESYYCMAGSTMVDDVDAVIAADRICDELGIDTMSAGATVAFAMECFEKKLICKEDANGFEIQFGDAEGMLKLIEMMAYRDGLGDLFSDGSRIAAQKIGKGSEKFTMQVKGLELPGYDARGAKAHALNYATAYTGADHNRGYAYQEIFGIPIPEAVDRFAIEGKGKLTKYNQDSRAVTSDCAPMCAFLLDMAVPGVCLTNTKDLVNSTTGLELTEDDVLAIGERMNNLAHAYNILAGMTRADDTLPYRFMNEAIPDGPSKGASIPQKDLDYMLDEYYGARGWDKNGVPTREKLTELNMPEVISKLEGQGCLNQ